LTKRKTCDVDDWSWHIENIDCGRDLMCLGVSDGQSYIKDVVRHDDAVIAADGLRPALDGVVNGSTLFHPSVDSVILTSPNARQQLSDQNRNHRRPLIGQGAMNAVSEVPPPAPPPAAATASYGALLPNIVAHLPVRRPIVKGEVYQIASVGKIVM